MTTNVATTNESTAVARPLAVLVPLIKAELQHAAEAAEQASKPHFEAAADMLFEARGQMSYVEFLSWAHRHFKIKETQARTLAKLGEERTNNRGRAQYVSMRDFQRRGLGHNRQSNVHPQPWHEPIKEVIGRVDTDTLNARKAELNRAEEREAQRKLGLQLIDIGWKALASKLHPDKGGSRDAMARLNAVRDRLKMHV